MTSRSATCLALALALLPVQALAQSPAVAARPAAAADAAAHRLNLDLDRLLPPPGVGRPVARQDESTSGTRLRTTGRLLVILGGAVTGLGVVYEWEREVNATDYQATTGTTTAIIASGLGMIGVGVPLWIVGRSREANGGAGSANAASLVLPVNRHQAVTVGRGLRGVTLNYRVAW